MVPPPPTSTLFPYTTLFRSISGAFLGKHSIPVQWLSTVREEAYTPEIIEALADQLDRKSTRLNSSHQITSYAVFCLKKKKKPIARKYIILAPTTHAARETIR